jgi:nucleotidyltransferase/DNA polymerase involved in DNA repair
MRKFLIERDLPGVGQMTEAEFRQVARKSVNVLRELGADIQWVQSYVTGDKLYCVYLAEDAELIREHARLGGFPCTSVSPIASVIDPASAE